MKASEGMGFTNLAETWFLVILNLHGSEVQDSLYSVCIGKGEYVTLPLLVE